MLYEKLLINQLFHSYWPTKRFKFNDGSKQQSKTTFASTKSDPEISGDSASNAALETKYTTSAGLVFY